MLCVVHSFTGHITRFSEFDNQRLRLRGMEGKKERDLIRIIFMSILWSQPVMSGLVEQHLGSRKELVFLHAFTLSHYKQRAASTNSIVWWTSFLIKRQLTLCMIFQMRSMNWGIAPCLHVLCMNLLQVMGGSGRLYTCFVSCHYCPCPAFAYTVLRRNEGPLVSLKLTVTHRLGFISNLNTGTECLYRFLFFFI